MTRRLAWAWACILALQGCDETPPPSDPPLADPSPPADPAVLACRADASAFVQRTLPVLHGRRPLGSTEVELLAGAVEQLEARGRDGRRVLATAVASGEDYYRRWTSEILDLLRTRRAGHRALGRCYGERGPAAETTALAQFVREHSPDEPFPGGAWSMRDLVESSLRADDLRPILRADLMVRMTSPIDDANTAPDDLERSRRTNIGRSFEATYLGRRMECLGCHRDDSSVTDHPDPALDRFWPVAQGLEHAVYPEHEEQLHAVFRWEGVADGGLPPWGAEGCGSFSVSGEHDPLPTDAELAGSFPAGANILDLQARLDDGLERLTRAGWSSRPSRPSVAVAQLVVMHLADGLWTSVAGHPLTLDHGVPRNEAQARRLRSLAERLVDSEYSLRALLVEIAVDPHLDQAAPADCEHEGPEPLPALFAPFVAADPQRGPGANGIGHAVHRRDPFALDDEVHRVLGRALPGQVLGQPGFDRQTMGALGAYLRESEPGHDGLDLLGALAWEDALDARPMATPAGESEGPTVTLDRLITAARDESSLTVGDLMVAVKDRILADPVVDDDERSLVSALVELSWDEPALEIPEPVLREAVHRYAKVLFATPQFVLAGVPGPTGGVRPRLRLEEVELEELCGYWGPRVHPDEPWWCTDEGLSLP